ncbi:MAG: hypothetical protein OEZ23_06430 [Gammaproteobacteria bacterium]|nr:hypothetical protein [Gammaproteobacteria bacterium]
MEAIWKGSSRAWRFSCYVFDFRNEYPKKANFNADKSAKSSAERHFPDTANLINAAAHIPPGVKI